MPLAMIFILPESKDFSLVLHFISAMGGVIGRLVLTATGHFLISTLRAVLVPTAVVILRSTQV